MKKIFLFLALITLVGCTPSALPESTKTPAKIVETREIVPIVVTPQETQKDTGSSSSGATRPALPRIDREALSYTPTFEEVSTDYSHIWNERGLAAAGGSLIDVDGDGIEEIFVSGGNGQADGLLWYRDGKFVNDITSTGLSKNETTYGAFVIDENGDGLSDIFVGRDSGLYLYTNSGDNKFVEQRIALALESDSVPIGVTGGDINGDGILDLYISTFVSAAKLRTATFNDSIHAKKNLLLIGKGNNIYEDISEISGTLFDQNTFTTAFLDLDKDGLLDIVVSSNTAKITLYRNKGNLTFEKSEPLPGYGFWMGLAYGDIDGDSDLDLFFSNVASSIPARLSRGDLRDNQPLDLEWRLLRNDGGFVFTDITSEKGLLGYGFAWGTVFEDWNLDGKLDLSVLENWIKWTPHKLKKLPGKMLIGSATAFTDITSDAGVENRYYGMTPLVSDWNRDGSPDMAYINLSGPVKAYLSNNKQNNSFTLSLSLSTRYLNTKIEALLPNGEVIYREFTISQGLYASQSRHIIIPLGQQVGITRLKLTLMNGEKQVYENITGSLDIRK